MNIILKVFATLSVFQYAPCLLVHILYWATTLNVRKEFQISHDHLKCVRGNCVESDNAFERWRQQFEHTCHIMESLDNVWSVFVGFNIGAGSLSICFVGYNTIVAGASIISVFVGIYTVTNLILICAAGILLNNQVGIYMHVLYD